jgi:hypothetical protein
MVGFGNARTGLIALIMWCVLASSSSSNALTFNFKGVIDVSQAAGDQSLIPDFAAGVTPGVTQVTGSFTYDPTQTGVLVSASSGGSVVQYETENFALILPAAAFSFDLLALVRNNVGSILTGPRDGFELRGAGIDGGGGLTYEVFFGLSGGSSIFPSAALPTTLDLAVFSAAIFSFRASVVDQSSQFLGEKFVSGRITELAVAAEVPLPAALPLFASGLGALVLVARRRKKLTH